MKILPHEIPGRTKAPAPAKRQPEKRPRRKGVSAAARRYGVSPAALHSFLGRDVPDWPPEKAARELRRRQQQRGGTPVSRKLEALGMARNAVARFRWYHRGTPKAEWSDDKIIEHLVARWGARAARANARVDTDSLEFLQARARAIRNGISAKLFRTRVNAHRWSLERAATTPPATARPAMSPETCRAILQRLDAGEKPGDLAAAFGVSCRSVYDLRYRAKKRNEGES